MPFVTLQIVIAIFITLTLVLRVKGHGFLIEPPSRSSLWRVGFDAPINYDDNALRCGGSKTQCGVCGDPVHGPKENQAGGKYAKGIIAREYEQGQVISVTVVVTANHRGHFEFHLCPHNDVNTPVSEDCLMANVLSLANGPKRFNLPGTKYGRVNMRVKLPEGISCSQCVLRWRWTAGNSWGRDRLTGRGCLGCGPQERFFGCADIRINNPVNSPQQPQQPQQPQPPPQSPPSGGSQLPGFVRPDGSSPAGSSNKNCKAINNWAGNAELDKWCDVSCNKANYCPAVFCACTN